MSSVARNEAFLTLIGDDEDLLLDWDIYASARSQCLPSMPRCWYRLSTRQRSIVRAALILAGIAGLITLIVTVAHRGGGSSPSQPQQAAFNDERTATQSNLGPPSTRNQLGPSPPSPSPELTPEQIDVHTPTVYPPLLTPDDVGTGTVDEEAPPQAPPTESAPASPPPIPAPAVFPMCTWDSYRLPSTVKPFLYDIKLQLDAALEHVTGSVRIALALEEAAPCLILHADPSLNISVQPLETADDTVPVEMQRPAGGRGGQLHVALLRPLPAGDAFLTLTFGYRLSDGLSGLYRAEYAAPDGTPQVVAATQFEPMSARKAFPCLDEPALKAPVQMQVTAPSNVTVLFNTDASATTDAGGGMVQHVFERTPPMATYLVAIVVGALVKQELSLPRQPEAAGGPLRVRVWGRQSADASLEFAAHAAVAAIQGMEEAVGVPYAGGKIGKLDLVSIPDFAAGAMENWGLITFREADLLVNSGGSTLAGEGPSVMQLYTVPKIIAHEVSHMWFGDLVTPPWWTELWLSEGFARFFEYAVAEFFWSEYDRSQLPPAVAGPGPLSYLAAFPSAVVDVALTADAQPSTFALARPDDAVQSEADAASMFGPIPYAKGASVLRMLSEHMLMRAAAGGDGESGVYHPAVVPAGRQGLSRRMLADAPPQENAFLKGLRGYLEAYQFGTGHTDTLLAAMETSTGMPVGTWLGAWTNRRGTPVVQVSKAGHKLRVEQIPPEVDVAERGAPPWWIPLTYRSIGLNDGGTSAETKGEGADVHWVEMHDTVVTARWPEEAFAVKVNAGQTGAFRVTYSDELWKALHDVVQRLTAEDIAGLLGDTWALACTSELPISHFLAFVFSAVDHSFSSAPTAAPSAMPLPAGAPSSAAVGPYPPPAVHPSAMHAMPPPPAHPRTRSTPTPAAVPAPAPSMSIPATPKPPTRTALRARAPTPIASSPAPSPSSPAATDGPRGVHGVSSKPFGRPGRRLGQAPGTGAWSPPRGTFGVWTAMQRLKELFSLVDAAEIEAEAFCSLALQRWAATAVLGPAARAVGLTRVGQGPVADIDGVEGWELRLTRVAIADLHAVLGPTTAVAEVAASVVPAYMAGEGPLHADVRGALMAVFVRTAPLGGETVLRVQRYLDGVTDAAERALVLRALSFQTSTVAAFEYVRSGQVAAQDIPVFIEGVAAVSQQQRWVMWQYCRDYRETLGGLLAGTLEGRTLRVMRLLARIAKGFASESRAQEVEDFFRGALGAQLPQYALEAVEGIRANVAARGRVAADTCTWLEYNFEAYLYEDDALGEDVDEYGKVYSYDQDGEEDYEYAEVYEYI